MKITQYPSLVEPITQVVPVTIDKWHKTEEPPIANWKYASQKNQFGVTFTQEEPFFNLGDPERTTPDKWIGQKPDKIWDIKRQQHTYQFYASNINYDILPPDDIRVATTWQTPLPQQLFQIKRQQFTYPSWADIDPTILLRGELVNIDKWEPEYPDYIWKHKDIRWTYPSLSIDTSQLTQPEAVSYDRFQPQYPDKIWDIKRQQFTYPTWTSNISYDTLPSDDVRVATTWQTPLPNQLFQLKRWQFMYPTWFGQEEEPAEEVSVDAWIPNTEKPRFDIKRQQYSYPFFFIDDLQLTQVERSTIDKWIGQRPDKIWDVKRQQYTYPDFMPIDIKNMSLVEAVNMDKWNPKTNEPLFDIKRWQRLYPIRAVLYEFPYPNAGDVCDKITTGWSTASKTTASWAAVTKITTDWTPKC